MRALEAATAEWWGSRAWWKHPPLRDTEGPEAQQVLQPTFERWLDTDPVGLEVGGEYGLEAEESGVKAVARL